MDDHKPYVLQEPGVEDNSPAGRRRFFPWLAGCLFLILLVAVAAAATLFLVNREGDDQAASFAEAEATTRSAETSTVPQDSLTDERSDAEPGSAQPPAGANEPEAVEPAPTGPPPTLTAEPAATDDLAQAPSPTDPPATETEPAEPPVTAEPAGEHQGRIAVVDDRARLWTVAADGSDRRLLSERGRFYQFPSWSPSGNDIAVIGSDFEGGGVYVVSDEREGEMRQLYADVESRPIYLYWSPSGDNVSFIASHQGGLALHLADKDGATAPDIVATSPSTFFWEWMPDGSQVLVHTGFTASNSDSSRLAFIPLDSGIETTEVVQQGFFQAPAVAADGRYYSYSDEDPTGRRWLSVQDIETEQQVELVFHQGVVAMGFSPTRAQLAYTSPERPAQSFYGPLRLVDLESGDSRLLVPETVLAYFWSPDGRSIAYLTLNELNGPFNFDDAPVASADEMPNGQIGWWPSSAKTRSLARLQSPPDDESRLGLGLSIIDVDSGESRLLTVFEPTDVFLNQFLPFFDQYALSHRIWSPDSQALVMPMEDDEGRSFIVVVPVDGGEPVVIAHGVVAFWSHR